jgi:hypothetical protein
MRDATTIGVVIYVSMATSLAGIFNLNLDFLSLCVGTSTSQ